MCVYIYVYIYIYSLQQSHSLQAGSPNPFSSMIDPIFHKRFFHSYVKSRAFSHVTLHLCFYVYSCVKKPCWRLVMPCHALAQGGAGRRRSTKPLLWSFHPWYAQSNLPALCNLFVGFFHPAFMFSAMPQHVYATAWSMPLPLHFCCRVVASYACVSAERRLARLQCPQVCDCDFQMQDLCTAKISLEPHAHWMWSWPPRWFMVISPMPRELMTIMV